MSCASNLMYSILLLNQRGIFFLVKYVVYYLYILFDYLCHQCSTTKKKFHWPSITISGCGIISFHKIHSINSALCRIIIIYDFRFTIFPRILVNFITMMHGLINTTLSYFVSVYKTIKSYFLESQKYLS